MFETLKLKHKLFETSSLQEENSEKETSRIVWLQNTSDSMPTPKSALEIPHWGGGGGGL